MNQSVKKKPNKGADNRRPNDFYRYSGMAIKMAIVIGLAVYAGIKLDENNESQTPWFTLLLALLGVGMAIYIVIRETAR